MKTPPLKKNKTPSHNHPDKKMTKLAPVVMKQIASNDKKSTFGNTRLKFSRLLRAT